MSKEHRECVEQTRTVPYQLDIPAIFTQFFSDIKPDKTISNIYNGPCSVQIGDLQHEAVLVQFEAAAQVFDAGSIHAAQMQKQHPVHSFLFDMKGTCLHANQAAIHHWYSQGYINMHDLKLPSLLKSDGSDGKLAASAALEAIFKQQQRRHQITLSTTDAQGM
ncbi:hypothetical protein WJX84_003815 [Apatococcus fuscideae]|uniref:Uncharacterized protein n=1 Tax=Apatococcus fuscideae TaxID=2026836 RepID=A0AAW1SMU4_9CHLO